MTAKEYLLEIRDTSKKLYDKLCDIAEIRAQKDGLKSIELSDKIKSSATYNSNIDNLLMREEMLLSEYNEIHKSWWLCRERIEQLDNCDFRRVLRHYYLRAKPWEQVAQNLHMSERKTFKLHGLALQEFRKKFGDEEFTVY